MKIVRALVTATLFALSTLLTPAGASTAFTTDQSDLWWNPSESGWGMQLVQRGGVIFATIFVYDQSMKPIWYSATLNYSGNLSWAGDLYVTNGPWLGTAAFNPNAVTSRKVGTIAWNAPFVESGTISYSVDGVGVSKNVVRQHVVYDNFSGVYVGALHQTTTGCSNAVLNGTGELVAGLSVVQNGTSVSLVSANENGGSCTFSGTLTQGGQFGRMVGNYSCDDGEVGTFNMFEMNVSYNALTARYTMNSTNYACQSTGYLGGIRHR